MNKFFAKKLTGSQKPIIITLVVVAITLLALVAFSIFSQSKTAPGDLINQGQVEQASGTPIDYADLVVMDQVEKDKFRDDVPANVIVPGVDTKLSEAEQKEIALPTVVVPAAPGSDNKYRNFSVVVNNNVFEPSKIIVNVGDNVYVDFTALDKDYDIVFPSYDQMQVVKKGQTKPLIFQALGEGSFTYYCSACGGPEAGPKGSFIIVSP